MAYMNSFTNYKIKNINSIGHLNKLNDTGKTFHIKWSIITESQPYRKSTDNCRLST